MEMLEKKEDKSKLLQRFYFRTFAIFTFAIALQIACYYTFKPLMVKDFAPQVTDEAGFNDTDASLDKLLQEAKRNKKYILFWQSRDRTRGKIDGKTLDYECGSCELTTNKSLVSNENTAAVIFGFKDIFKGHMPPRSLRRSDQLYLWQSKEPMMSLLRHATDHKEYYTVAAEFNGTMTYRRDSYIYHPYEGATPSEVLLNANLSLILQRKKHLALALVSHCDGFPGANFRFNYLSTLLKKGFDLTAGGSCFDTERIPKTDIEGLLTVMAEYKFYFAFENSLRCRDYITEKFFRPLRAGTVPVVWGAERKDYDAVAPPYSFIHVDDFGSEDDLIRYLNFLDKNDTAYMEYFRWRTKNLNEFPRYQQKTGTCQLCRIIHGYDKDYMYNEAKGSPKTPRKTPRLTIRSIHSWMISTENAICMANAFQERGKRRKNVSMTSSK